MKKENIMPENAARKCSPSAWRHAGFALCAALLIIAADQYSKWLVMETLLRAPDAASLPFGAWLAAGPDAARAHITAGLPFSSITVTAWLNIVMVFNRGISFGMLGGQDVAPLVLAALATVITLGLFVWMLLEKNRFFTLAVSFIIGGALGNVLDRIRFGAVADFIDLHAGALHWPAFNIADAFVVAGAVLLMLHTVISKNDRTDKGA